MVKQSIQDRYYKMLKTYFSQPEEKHLVKAAELGRELILADVPPEDIAELHEEAIRRLAGELPDITLLETGRQISAPLMEMLMAYGLAFRERLELRNKAEKALRASEEKYRLLFENMMDGFALHEIVLNKKGKPVDYVFLEVNSAFEQLTGLKRKNIISKKATEVLPGIEKDPSDWIGKYGKVALTGQEIRFDQYSQPLGKWYSVLAFSPRKGRFAIIFEDITESKQTEEEIRKLNEELEQRIEERTAELEGRVYEVEQLNQAMLNISEDLQTANANLKSLTQQLTEANKELEAFTYSVSHDLRAPLRAIDGFSQILLEDHAKPLGKEGLRILDVIRDNTKNMGQLIDDLLAFSHLGRKEMIKTRINMAKMVQGVQKELEPEASGRQIQWNLNRIPPAYGDFTMIRQVYTNLLSNAVKFTRLQKKAEISVGYQIKGKETIYFVKDNGVGFNMKYKDKLFDVFQRLHSTTEFEGTGVGLAIVKRLIQKHGGRVWAEGKVDQGATFYFSLPIKGDK